MRNDKFILRWAKRLRAIDLLGGKCVNCGETDILLLDFHHRDPKQKKYGLCQISAHMAWTTIEIEAKKCDLLCCKCHALHHREILRERIQQNWEQIQLKMKVVHEVSRPPLDKDFIYEQLKQKKTIAQIASILGKGANSVSEVARKLERDRNEKLFLSRDEWNSRIRKVNVDEAVTMRVNGIRIVDIAAHFDSSVSNIYAVLTRAKKRGLDVNARSIICQGK